MVGKQLRFTDLLALNIVNNRVTLNNWIRDRGFPGGTLIGPNTRVWDEAEVEAWLASRPTAPKPPVLKPSRRGRPRKNPAQETGVFVALFEDGRVIRTTPQRASDKFDLERGIADARAAYENKTGNSTASPIVAAQFVAPGYNATVLAEYYAATTQTIAPDATEPTTEPTAAVRTAFEAAE